MDVNGTRFQKIHAINKAKKYQLLGNIFLYSMAVLTCIVFSSFFWFITSGLTSSSSRVSVFGSIPKLISVFLSYKSVFIFGNVIVIVLIGESKFFAPNHSATGDVYYNEYINQKRSFQSPASLEVKKTFEVNEYLVEKSERSCVNGEKIEEKKWCEEKKKKQSFEREDEVGLSTEELNRRADDFISRVNKQRRLEAKLLVC